MAIQLPPLPSETEPAPHVEFELRSVEDRHASVQQGMKIMKDQEFILIYPRGGKDMVEKVVPASPQKGQYPTPAWQEFNARFGKLYAAWKEGQELPVEGTDLRTFRLLTPAQIDNCRELHIFTVEQLAEANEETLKNIGMGSRNLKMTAQRWLEFGEGGGKQVTRMEDLEAKNAALTDLVKQLEAKLDEKPKSSRKSPKRA
jgi:hypothetical protein